MPSQAVVSMCMCAQASSRTERTRLCVVLSLCERARRFRFAAQGRSDFSTRRRFVQGSETWMLNHTGIIFQTIFPCSWKWTTSHLTIPGWESQQKTILLLIVLPVPFSMMGTVNAHPQPSALCLQLPLCVGLRFSVRPCYAQRVTVQRHLLFSLHP